MRKNRSVGGWLRVLAFSALSLSSAPVFAQGSSAFTYQGVLRAGGTNANGTYTMIFRLYDATGGSKQIGSTITTNPPISNGLFTANLDFGATAFNGSARWLDITVQSGSNSEELTPRVQVLPTPYALFANSANSAGSLLGSLPAAQLTNALASAQLSGTYSNPMTFNNRSNSFSGDGSGLTNLPAVPATNVTGLGTAALYPSNQYLGRNLVRPPDAVFWDDFQRPDSTNSLGQAPSISPVTGTNYVWEQFGALPNDMNIYIRGGAYTTDTSLVSNVFTYPMVDLGFNPTHFGVLLQFVTNGYTNGPWYTGGFYPGFVFILTPNSNGIPGTSWHNVISGEGDGRGNANGAIWTQPWSGVNQSANWPGFQNGQIIPYEFWVNGDQISMEAGGGGITTAESPLVTTAGGRYLVAELTCNTNNPCGIFKVLAIWAGDNTAAVPPSSNLTASVFTTAIATIVTNQVANQYSGSATVTNAGASAVVVTDAAHNLTNSSVTAAQLANMVTSVVPPAGYTATTNGGVVTFSLAPPVVISGSNVDCSVGGFQQVTVTGPQAFQLTNCTPGNTVCLRVFNHATGNTIFFTPQAGMTNYWAGGAANPAPPDNARIDYTIACFTNEFHISSTAFK